MEVKVVKNKPKYIPFSDVKVGETFRLKDNKNNKLWLKFPLDVDFEYNAIVLTDMSEEVLSSNIYMFDKDISVYLVKTELTIYED